MRLLGYLRLIPPLLRLLVRLDWTLAGVGLAKRRALRAYEGTLKREGLPEPFVSGLVADYDLGLGELLHGGLAQIRARATKDRAG